MDVEKSQRVPLSVFFSAVWDFFPKMKILFSSIFSCFATEWMLKNLKGPPFQFFGIVRLYAPLGPFFWVCNFFEKKYFQKISNFEYCKRVLDTWKSFCYFWALDMAPTWADPGLFSISAIGDMILKSQQLNFFQLSFRRDFKYVISSTYWKIWTICSAVSGKREN